MTEGEMELDFDRAQFGAAAEDARPCGVCKGALGGEYWQYQQQVLCAACRDKLRATFEAAKSPGSLARAALQGVGVALGCGIAYAVFVAVTSSQFALVTIGIAFVIAKVIRKATRGVGGRRFQILAVALTYVASAMGYAPAVWKGLTHSSQRESAPMSATAKGGSASSPAVAPSMPDSKAAEGKPGDGSSSEQEPSGETHPSLGGLFVALIFFFGITMAAPILAATEAPIGLLIVGFGLWEAWKLSRGVPVTIEGPYKIAPASPPSP